VTHVKPVRVRTERVPFPLVSVKTESWGAIEAWSDDKAALRGEEKTCTRQRT
jgi:hypothetical protein